MNKQQKQALHRQLDEQLVELSTAIANLELQRGSLAPDTSIGRISRMEAIEAASVNNTKMDNYHRREQALNSALVRLEQDPGFGYCEECGKVIPAGRLALIPEATTALAALSNNYGKAAQTTSEPERFPFFWPMRVRYAEIDAQNVVFNAHYLTYFDVALTEACRVSGHDWMADMQQSGCDFQLVKSLVEYRQPLRFDDEFEVAVAISRLGRSSVSWQLAVFVAGELYASGEIVWVYTDLKAVKSAPLSAKFKQLVVHRQLLLAAVNAD